MKNIAILGSTGSIGTQTLDVARKNEDLRVVAVSAGKSVEKLEEQIREFHPLLAAVWDEEAARDLKTRIADTDTKVVSGMEGLLELASMPESEILVTAIVGMIGIRPTMEGIRAGKDIALANKETLVTAGHLIMPMAKKYGVSILPVDSEHSAIFQAIHGEENKEIHKLLRIAWDKYQDDDGYVNVSSAGQYIKRAKPDFDARTYGYVKLPELIEAFPKRYSMKRYPGKGTVTIIAYKCL